MLLAAFVVLWAAAELGGLADAVKKPSAFDTAANAFFGPYRHGPALAAFLWITMLGAGPTVLASVLIATGLLATTDRRATVGPLWLVYLGMEATVWSAKYAIGRVRPDFISAASAASPSFPSGHSAGALAIYGFLAYVIALRLVDARQRAGVFLFAAGVILAVGFSRIFLSVHFVTDVLAGYAIGGAWLLAGIVVCRRTASG